MNKPRDAAESAPIVASLRHANERDANDIATVLYAAFRPYQARYTPDAFDATAITPEEVRCRMREGPVWVAEIDGAVIGTVSAAFRPRVIYVRGMAVAPQAQRRGVGHRLLQEVERYANESGVRSLELATTPFLAAARELYQRHGFRCLPGEMTLHGTPLFAMVKDLEASAPREAAPRAPIGGRRHG
jgi:GNAT superfamily N-acetyltransferase